MMCDRMPSDNQVKKRLKMVTNLVTAEVTNHK